MKTLWEQLVHKIAKKIGLYGTLKSEQALREKNHKIYELEQHVEQLEQQVGFAQRAIAETTLKRHAVVYIDRTVQGAYDQPSPVTDPELQRRLEARKHQEALQADILAEQQRKQKMKTFVASITGQPNVSTSELPAMTGDLRRKWQTGQLKLITLTKPTQKLDSDDAFLL